MIAPLLIFLSVAATSPPDAPPPVVSIEEASKAIAAGRFDQARIMISRAMSAGAKGELVDRALADLAFSSGRDAEAFARYQQLVTAHPQDSLLLERAAIAALRVGNVEAAAGLIDRAAASPDASWRVWNARGTIADLRHDWEQADEAYGKADASGAKRPEVLNNRGWSLVLRGEWAAAIDYFEQAAALDPHSSRIANNLELAREAVSADLPRRASGESDRDWAARLNDAGVAANLLGDRKRAIAAFSQALEASGTWYERAANNLQAVSGQ
jgi:Flp pilus assembly protein TadD